MNNKSLFAMLFLLMGLGLFNFNCCDDCPSCPEPPVDPDGYYNFYIQPNSGDHLYIYNIEAKAIIDSLYMGRFSHFEVSGDGNSFYICPHWSLASSDTMLVLSNPDLDTLGRIPIWGDIEVSNTGSYFAVIGDSLVIYDANTFNPIIIDTANVWISRFSLIDDKFYCISSLSKLRIYDLINQELDTVITITIDTLGSPAIHAIQTITDPEVIYLTLTFNDDLNYLISYHIDSDSCGLWYRLTGRASGSLAYSGLREFLFVTDPDNSIGNFGSRNVTIIDTDKNIVYSVIHPEFVLNHNIYAEFNPRQVVVTPDDRYLFVLDGWGRGYAIIDLLSLSIYDTYKNYYMPLYDVSCQKLK